MRASIGWMNPQIQSIHPDCTAMGIASMSMPKQGRVFGRSASARRVSSRGAVRLMASADPGFCRDKVSTPKREIDGNGAVYNVTFLGADGQKVVMPCPDNRYILDVAEENDIELPWSCRAGICGCCVARVASGKIDQSDVDDLSFTLEEGEVEQGMTLLCMARACSDVEIETQQDWGYSLGVTEWKGASGRLSAEPEPLMGTKWTEM